MAYTAEPTGDDLTQFMAAAGITLPTDLLPDLDGAAAAGVRSFERQTRRKFLAETADSVRRFDPPLSSDGILYLPVDYAAVTSIEYLPLGGTATAWVADTDYVLLPSDAVAAGVPYDRLHILAQRWYSPLVYPATGAIRITGKVGWGTEIPDDAWLAMRAIGAQHLFGVIGYANRGGLVSFKEADVQETYAADPLQGFQQSLDSNLIQPAIRAYRRPAGC